MKMSDAQKIIDKPPRSGCVVKFTYWKKGYYTDTAVDNNSGWATDYFPEVMKGEPGIPTEVEAWRMARALVQNGDNEYYDVHVCNALTFERISPTMILNPREK